MTPTILKSFCPKNRKAWRQWLQKQHLKEPGVWLIYYKKSSGKKHISYNDAVEEALCFGWIDSIMKPVDDEKYMQKFTPRKAKSVWSALNKRRVKKLLEENLMMPAGLEIIKLSKQNGSWIKLDNVENFEIPADLKNVFVKNKKLLIWFEGLAKSNQKQWLYRLHNAKLLKTKSKRITALIEAYEKKTSKSDAAV